MLENSLRTQQKDLLEIPDEVAEAIEIVLSEIKEGNTIGHAPEDLLDCLDGYVNVIPSKHKGMCTHILITLCYDKDNFEGRIFESLDHAAKICPDICRNVFLLSTQWNSVIVNKLSGYIESVRKNGINVYIIYMTQKGIVVMPV